MPDSLIGVDLGHGETAVALAASTATTEPRILEIQGQRNIISAVARAADGRTLIGEEALVANDVTSLRIRFKSRHLDDPETRETVGAFVRRLAELIRVSWNGPAEYLAGVPSGWDAHTRRQYEELIRAAGITPVRVMAESRAAFISAREERALGVPDEVLAGSVLIIDIGSSTTDFTAVSGLREQPADRGDNELGGGILDVLIFEQALRQEPNRAALEDVFRRAPWMRARCELACRKVKEMYFSNEERYATQPAMTTLRIPTQPPMYFEPSLTKAEMDRILETPIPSRDGRTWPQVFRDWLEDYKSRHAADPPQLILLTGGASRMTFTNEICREVFPEARVVRGTEPEFAIAKGLAWAGRIDYKTTQFEADVEQLLASREIDAKVDTAIPTLLDGLARALAAELPRACVLPEFREWRDGRVRTLVDLEGAIERRMEAWLKGPEGSRFLAAVFADWFDSLRPGIESLTNPISDRYGIPRRALGLPSFAEIRPTTGSRLIDPVDIIGFEDFAIILNIVMSLVIATLVGGAGTALIMHGPAGWIIGLVVSLVVFGAGKGRAKEHIKNTELPAFVRKLIPESRVENSLEDRADELRAKITDTFRQRPDEVDAIRRSVADAVRRDLGKSAESARLLIR